MNARSSADDLVERYSALMQLATENGAVVVSAEPLCCVLAPSHQPPLSIFYDNGIPGASERGCPSGQPDCLHRANDWSDWWWDAIENFVDPWQEDDVDSPYLNAGLVAGPAEDVLAIYRTLALNHENDEQAVMTEYMLWWPAKVVLDDQQSLSGNSAWQSGGAQSCPWELHWTNSLVRHTMTGTWPSLLHFSGKNHGCQ